MAEKSHRNPLFLNAIETIFNNWSALQLAIDHQLGGPDSKAIAMWMVSTVENFFYENDKLEGWEVADYIGEIISNEFHVDCEDGSLEEIGDKLCHFFRLCESGKNDEVDLELKRIPKSTYNLSKSTLPSSSTPATTDIVTPMNSLQVTSENATITKNIPDEDGWITVSKGKKG